MSNLEDKGKMKHREDEQVEIEKEINREALDVVFRLYDGTFKELVDR